MPSLTETLRMIIRRSGRSLNSIAKDCGIGQPVLWRFVNGKDLRLKTVDRLADYFKLNLRKGGEWRMTRDRKKNRDRNKRREEEGQSNGRQGNSSYVPPQFEFTDDLDGETKLRETMERELPEFCLAVKEHDKDIMFLHQDAFASGYHIKEYALLGMAIKYAGLYGLKMQIIGTNGETC